MKKLYFSLFLLFFLFTFHIVKAQELVGFDFQGANGDESSWSTSFNDPSVTSSTITRGSSIIAYPNADRFNSKNWPTGGLDPNSYLEFTTTPSAGYSITIDHFQIQHQRSSNGPTKFVIRTSLDGFASNATNEIAIGNANTLQNSTFNLNNQIITTTPVTFRIYAYSAVTSNGTWGPGSSVNGNDLLVFGPNSTLPLTFERLTATLSNGKIQLQWGNLSESNIEKYVIERSTQGNNFSAIATIIPKLNNGQLAVYQYPDKDVAGENLFYRIKAIEISGKVYYSEIAKINIKTSATSLLVYPNPIVNKQLNFQLNNLPTGNYTIAVYNNFSQMVSKQTINHSGTSASYQLLINDFKPGVYYLSVSGAFNLKTQFVVQ